MKNKSLMGTALPFLTVVASLSFSSCQDEDFGYDQSDIRQAYLNRKYAEEFKKQFPNADPNHTWMCDPDTFGIESLIGTRAYPTGVPTITNMNQTVTKDNDFITSALKTLGEGDDNRGKVSQSFEYYAAIDDGASGSDNKSEFTVTPTFWGRKFVDTNAIGVYYINDAGKKVDLEPFWNDREKRGITVHYKDGYEELAPMSDQQITDEPMWCNHERNTKKYPNEDILKLGHKCPYCGIDIYAHGGGKYVLVTRDNTINNYNSKFIELTTNSSNPWETQLVIKTPNKTWTGGDDYVLTFRYQVSKTQNVSVKFQDSQGQKDLCDAYTGGNGQESNKLVLDLQHSDNLDEWKTFYYEGKIAWKDASGNSVSGVQAIVLNLANESGVTYRFSEVNWYYKWDNDTDLNNHINSGKGLSSLCSNGKYLVESYKLPKYKLEVPVGMKFGFYLETKQQQKEGSNTIRWYSNADFNKKTTNVAQNITSSIMGNVSAAATYVGNDGTYYCCFEDAACKLHDYQKPRWDHSEDNWSEGNCYCGYGHYDTDYNDIVLSIVGNPVITSYTAVKYRVMCEDLGGTYDWDFNDLVYDVEYADAPNGVGNATVKVSVQAVGGTFPIYMQFDSNFSSNNIISSCAVINNTNQRIDLHNALYGQQQDNKGIYLPVNVDPDGGQNTVTGRGSKLVCTYYLNAAKYPSIDARRFVELIHIYVEQKTKNGNSTTTLVNFPTNKGNSSVVPECFMTSINASWTREHQNIGEKFPGFMNWVNDNKKNNKWWDAGIGM